MYTLVYRRREIESSNIVKSAFISGVFRLKKSALHYLWDIVQNEYKDMGYATEVRVGGLYCYKSCKNTKGERKIIEETIKVEKC